MYKRIRRILIKKVFLIGIITLKAPVIFIILPVQFLINLAYPRNSFNFSITKTYETICYNKSFFAKVFVKFMRHDIIFSFESCTHISPVSQSFIIGNLCTYEQYNRVVLDFEI